MKRRNIAVLMSLLFAAPAAVIALAQSESSAPTVEIQAVPVEPVIIKEEAAIVADQTGQPVAVAESTTVVAPAVPVVAEVTYVEPKRMSTAEWLRVNEFSMQDGPRMLPSQIAYFDRIEQERRHLVANSAPAQSADDARLLPAQMAYFERREQAIARAQAPIVASTPAPVVITPSAEPTPPVAMVEAK